MEVGSDTNAAPKSTAKPQPRSTKEIMPAATSRARHQQNLRCLRRKENACACYQYPNQDSCKHIRFIRDRNRQWHAGNDIENQKEWFPGFPKVHYYSNLLVTADSYELDTARVLQLTERL